MQSVDSKHNVVVEPEIEVPTSGSVAQVREKPMLAYLSLLWQQRKFLGRFVLLSFVISTVIAFLIPKQYKATAQIMPPGNQSSALSMLAGLANIPGGLGGMVGDLGGQMMGLGGLKTTGATFVGMLQSRSIADHLITQFNLQKVYSVRYVEKARKKLWSRTEISEDRKSGIISVTVTDKDPRRAADMAQAYVTELDRLVSNLSTSGARREREFLEIRLQVAKKELEQSEIEFSQFSSKHSTLDIKEQGRAMLDAAARVQAELIAAQTEIQGLRQIYADNNVRVRSAQARVSELQRKLNELGGQSAPVSSATNSTSDFSYPSIRELPALGVTYASLYRRVKTAELVYGLLTGEYERAKIEEVKEIPVVKELDRPVVPERKSFPPRLLIVLFGTVFAFLCAAASIFAAQRWKEMDANDQRKQLAIEVLRAARKSLSSLAKALRLSGSGREVAIEGAHEQSR